MVDQRSKMMEETVGPQLKQLRQWYDVVARGVEPGSEAQDCLDQVVVAIDIFNDALSRDDTDGIIQTFDAAVASLKVAAAARPRREGKPGAPDDRDDASVSKASAHSLTKPIGDQDNASASDSRGH